MHLNRLVGEVLGEDAVELLDTLIAHAMASAPAERSSLFCLPVEEHAWNGTLALMREIFEAEVVVPRESEWLALRILQPFGVEHGQLVYQFTPTFAQAIARR